MQLRIFLPLSYIAIRKMLFTRRTHEKYDMTKMKIIKPLLYWSVFSRLALAVSLSAITWLLILGITDSP